MTLNWRRGFIRVWLVGSVCWVVAVGWLTWSSDITDFLRYAYTAVTDPGKEERVLDAWRAKTNEAARPWNETKARIWADHGLQRQHELTIGDLRAALGPPPNNRWFADFCATEFKGIDVTQAECDELKRVAAAIPAVPTPAEAATCRGVPVEDLRPCSEQEWWRNPLVEWSGPVFMPPIAAMLICLALAWALRGFRVA